jgi:hypothetical protein
VRSVGKLTSVDALACTGVEFVLRGSQRIHRRGFRRFRNSEQVVRGRLIARSYTKDKSCSIRGLEFLSFLQHGSAGMSRIDLFPLGFDGQLMRHRDYGHGKWRSSIVSNDRKPSCELVTAQHRVLVIRGVHHHVRMPRANSRPEILVRREHIRECHRFHFRQLAFGVRRLNSFGNLVRCLAFHS